MIRLYILALLSILAMIAGAVMLTGGDGSSAAPSTQASGSAKTASNGYYNEPTVIKRNASGQFFIRGAVNGQDTRFLIDTGADVVALSIDEAEQLGVEFDPSSFEAITQTASGPGYGQKVTIERLDVAGRELENVSAVVVEGLDVNLLGQSVLRQLGRIEMRGNALVIDRS